ncbi:MAG: glycosyltransferase family 4 protein [Bacteroidota bacterium]
MPKKILIFSLAYYPSFVSGAEAAIKEITDRIDPKEVEFHMLTLLFDKHAARHEQIGNVHVHRIGFGGAYLSKILFIPLAAWRARSMYKNGEFDAMWAMMTYMLLPLTFAKWLGVKTPYALTLQDGDPYEKVFERWFIRPLTPVIDWGFKHADAVQVISEYLGTWPKKRGYTGDVIMVRNGANPKNFSQFYSDAELNQVKDSLGKKESDFYMFIAARLVYQKAQDIIIKSLTHLPENVHLLIAGAGPDESMLRELTAELKLEHPVKFLGALERDDVPKYRNTIVSDAFVHPSRSEGLGLTLLSAMAAHVPVITTQVGGLADYIFDEKRNPDKAMTAWAVDPDAPEQIAEAVKDVMGNPEKVQQVTTTARALVEAEYNWDPIAKQMQLEVFRRLWT